MLLLVCAFQNKFVLLHFGDTAKYLEYGFGWNHSGRYFAIGYGLFARIASLGYTLWLVAIIQSIVCYYLIKEFINSVFYYNSDQTASIVKLPGLGRNRAPQYALLVISILVFTTSLSRLSSTIMPDLFAGLAGLAITNALLAQSQKRTILNSLLAALLGVMHTSLWSIYVLYIILIFICLLLKVGTLKLKKTLLVSGIILLVIPFTILTNYVVSHSIYFGSSGIVTISARMADSGLLNTYLKRHCKEPGNQIHPAFCAAIDTYYTDSDFFWKKESPLHQIVPHEDMDKDWEDETVRASLSHVVTGIFQDPTMWPDIVKAVMSSWGSTMFYQNYVSDTQRFPWLEETLMKYLVTDLSDYRHSAQALGTWNGEYDTTIRERYQISVFISIAGIAVLFLFDRLFGQGIPAAFRYALYSLVAFIFLHALVCGTFSGPHPRYADRVNWLIVLWLVTYLFFLVEQKLKEKSIGTFIKSDR
jgi:hypothetical protein